MNASNSSNLCESPARGSGLAFKRIRHVDVAEAAGVSRASVSFVLNGREQDARRVSSGTRRRIERIAKKLGYFPNIAARQLKGGGSYLIGVLIHQGASQVLFERIDAFEREAIRAGYHVLVGQLGGDMTKLSFHATHFASYGVDGVLCMAHETAGARESVDQILSRFSNIVYLRKPTWSEANFVHVDAADGIIQAVDYLRKKGRQRIGMVLTDQWRQANRHRRDGYVESMNRQGLTFDDSLIWVEKEGVGLNPHGATNARANEVVEFLVGRSGADAIIAINDNWAAQLIKALRRRGSNVPEDVSVIGHGNFKIARYSDPEITTLDPCNGLFAKEAMKLLVGQIQNRTSSQDHQSICVKPKLIIRESA